MEFWMFEYEGGGEGNGNEWKIQLIWYYFTLNSILVCDKGRPHWIHLRNWHWYIKGGEGGGQTLSRVFMTRRGPGPDSEAN